MNTKSKGFLFSRTLFSFVILFLLLSISFGFTQNSQKLPFFVLIRDGSNVQFFNKYLLDDDIVGGRGKGLRYLKRIVHAKTALVRQSIIDLRSDLSISAEQNIRIDQVWYNPESWKNSHTSEYELNNLFDSVNIARELANQSNSLLGIAPDVILLEKYGAALSLKVDIFGIGNVTTFQLKYDNLNSFREEVQRLINLVRKGSKTVPIFIQLSLAPQLWQTIILPNGKEKLVPLRDSERNKVLQPIPAELVLEQIEAVKDLVQGIVIYSFQHTKNELQRLILMKDSILR